MQSSHSRLPSDGMEQGAHPGRLPAAHITDNLRRIVYGQHHRPSRSMSIGTRAAVTVSRILVAVPKSYS